MSVWVSITENHHTTNRTMNSMNSLLKEFEGNTQTVSLQHPMERFNTMLPATAVQCFTILIAP